MQHQRWYAWARRRNLDSQEFVDGVHDAVNTAIDAALNVLFEAADHLDDMIDDLRERAACREPGTGPTAPRNAWSDTD